MSFASRSSTSDSSGRFAFVPIRWRQFSIRGLLALTTAIAVLLALPGEVTSALAWLVTALAIPLSIVVIVWGQPADRAFAIGVLSGALLWLTLRGEFGVSIRPERDPLVFWPLTWGWIAAAGFACRKTREIAVRRASSRGP